MKRRDFMKLGLATGGAGLGSARGSLAADPAWRQELLKFLCPPDDRARELNDQPPSPEARPFVTPLFIPPIMEPRESLTPAPDPRAHQRYGEFPPKRLYEIYEQEFRWQFHIDPPYTVKHDGREIGSWTWGFGSPHVRDPRTGKKIQDPTPSCPGPTYAARYGEPVLARRFNDLPTTGHAKVSFALPSTTSHLHNGHTASESDGNPQDWIDSGEFWDHHYANFPSGFDPREKLTTLWYHDHRLDFTAANVYAGLAGFYFLFDDEDTGDERTGWHLPSFPRYDIPLILQDIRFNYDPTSDPAAGVQFDNWNTDGMLGDRMTVNRRITPFLQVEPRKYRFRILNGGPSRFYQLFLRSSRKVRGRPEVEHPNFLVITGDGNFQPEPMYAESIFLSVAQRVDVIMDFSNYKPGDHVYLQNLLEQVNGAGPSGRCLDFDDPASFLVRFDVVEPNHSEPDRSRIPDYFRPLPDVDMAEVRQHRTWDFDYDGGLWTINGRVMDPNRIDAGIEQGSAEIWTFRNGGNDWSHPIHSHFSEFMLLEVNGKPFHPHHIRGVPDQEEVARGGTCTLRPQEVALVEYLGLAPGDRPPLAVFMGGQRRDVATLLPGDEVKLFMRWKDFLGKHVMHCHNVVHEDHAMMIRWDIMEPGRGFVGPREAAEVYGADPPPFEPPYPDPRPPAKPHVEERPGNPVIGEG